MASINADLVSDRDHFITLRSSQLFLDSKPFRFASFNAPELLALNHINNADATTFELFDTLTSIQLGFARPVARTYTMRIKSRNIAKGHINGWSDEWGDWIWDEAALVEMDRVICEARARGVRLVIPIVNQDYGSEETNWVGNFSDLIRMRKGLQSYEQTKMIDWWTDEEMNNSFKLIIDKLTSRRNSFNGLIYAEDATILAWETGNEMNYRGNRSPPASWTLLVAKHLKSRAPNTLVMDGSFARTSDVSSCFPSAVLESSDIDIVSYHYYGDGDISRVGNDCRIARLNGKALVSFTFQPCSFSTSHTIMYLWLYS